MKKDEKSDTLAVINNYNVYDGQTDINTDMATFRTDPAQRAESVKIHMRVLASL